MIRSLDDIITEWGEDVIGKIRRNLDDTGTTASGKTKQSLELVKTDKGFQIVGRQYFRSVEEGRPEGGIPYRFQDIIRKWMDDKGVASQFGSTESEKRSAAWLIAQKIKNEGSRLYRNGGRDDIYTSVINEELPELFHWIEGSVTETIIKELNVN